MPLLFFRIKEQNLFNTLLNFTFYAMQKNSSFLTIFYKEKNFFKSDKFTYIIYDFSKKSFILFELYSLK